jgi:multiple sugar transport system ATP-binding protein
LRNVDAKLRFEMRLELPRLLADQSAHGDLRHAGLPGGDGAGRPDRGAERTGRIRAGRTPEEIYFDACEYRASRSSLATR